MRRENERLRANMDSAPKDVTGQPAVRGAERDDNVGRLQKDKTDLLRLRNKVRLLREAAVPAAAHARPAPSRSATQSRRDEISRLGVAAMRGEYGALEQLAKIAADSGMNANEKAALYADFQRTFAVFGAEAGGGNSTVLQTLWQASRIPELEGFAVEALGQAAGMGNAEALKPLLDPEDYLIMRSLRRSCAEACG